MGSKNKEGPARPRRLIVAGLVALACTLAVLGLGYRTWEAPGLAAKALERIEREAGWRLESETARLVAFRGLELGAVTGTIQVGAGRGELVAESVRLEHRPLALLGGRLELESLVLVRPRLTLTEPAPRPPQPSQPPRPPGDASQRQIPPAPPEPELEEPSDGTLRFALRSVVIEEGSLVVARSGESRGLRVEGLDLTLEEPVLSSEVGASFVRSLSTSGRFRAASVELPVGAAEALSGRFSVENGRLLVPDLELSNAHGDFTAELEVQLGTAPLRYAVRLIAEPLDLHALFDSPERASFGEARFEADLRGMGTARDAITGSGRLSVASGRLPSFPILNHIEAGLRRLTLHRAEHGPIEARFTFAEGALELEPFELDAAELHVDGRGRVGLDGALDLSLELSSEPEGISLRGVPDDLVDLMRVEEGRLSIPVVVSGTTEQPRARADAAVLARRSRDRGLPVDEAALRLRLDEIFGLEG